MQSTERVIGINGNGQINSVLFADDGEEVWSSDCAGMSRRWRADDGREVGEAIVSEKGYVYAAALSPDGRWLVCGLYDSTPSVKVWDAKTFKKVLDIDSHRDANGVCSVDVSPDSTKIATGGSGDGLAFVFSITTGKQLVRSLRHAERYVTAVRFAPNASRLATTDTTSLRIFSSYSGQQLLHIPWKSGAHLCTPLAWSADCRQLFVVSPNEAKHFDTSSGRVLGTWSIPHGAHNSPSLAISRNQKFIAIIANTSLSFWDTSTHERIGPVFEHTSSLWSVSLSPTDDYIATGEQNGKITIRRLCGVLPASYLTPTFPLHQPQSFLEVDEATFSSWVQDDLLRVEQLLTEKIPCSSNSTYHARALAHRALVRLRLKQYVMAMDDATQSLAIQGTAIGHIANALCLVGKKGQDTVTQAFDLASRDCLPNEANYAFLLLIKARLFNPNTCSSCKLISSQAIVFFLVGNVPIALSRVQDLMVNADNGMMYACLQVFGNIHLKQGDYVRATESLERAQNIAPSYSSHHLTTISLVSYLFATLTAIQRMFGKIFGWSFEGLDTTVQTHSCEALYDADRVHEAAQALLRLMNVVDGRACMNRDFEEWISGFSQRCATKLAALGDEAVGAKRYDDAISHYTTALSLIPVPPVGLLLKRSKAWAQKMLWTDALEDANEAIHLDPSHPWGYEAKHAALLALKQYDEATSALHDLLSAIEKSPDSETRRLRDKYVSPSQTESDIDSIARNVVVCPLVLIDVKTGRLCDGSERMRRFKLEIMFKELVASMTREVDKARIQREVTKYFQYVTLSHMWKGREPLYQDVLSAVSVESLDRSTFSDKLRKFCEVARKDGYRWAWSDTCCIDKSISTVLNESITLMYKWYEDSAATLIYLADVKSPSSLGDLIKSLWMTRAWTLQELLAPKVVRFYDSNWKPYLGDKRANHKDSPEIMGELAKAIQAPIETITSFRPDGLGIREKLRLASTRMATREEDIAYSLIGIFQSNIKPNYGDREKALGQLLDEIVGHSGDVTVLAWTGKSSSYNSCLPASLAVYRQTPRTLTAFDDAEMGARIASLERSLSPEDVMPIYHRINGLPLARFANRRLYLPCIVFSVKKIGMQVIGNGENMHFRARVSGIGAVEFQTADKIPSTEPRRLVLVHPWIRDLCDLLDGFGMTDDESESDDLDGESEAGSAPMSSPVHAVPAARVDRTSQGMRLVARLQQPFHGLLLEQQSNANREFKRIAADCDIIAPGLDRRIDSVKDIRTEVLEIL